MSYRLFPSTNGPSTSVTFAPAIIVGTLFKVTSPGMVLQGYWYWRCDSAQTTSASFALWQATGTGTGSVVSNSTASISGMTAGQWNYQALAVPLALTSGTVYKAQAGFVGNFSETQHSFGSGNTYAAGITNGPLFAFSDSGGSAPDSFGDTQCTYSTGSSNPSSGYVTTADNSWNCWIDVQVDYAASNPSYTLLTPPGRSSPAAFQWQAAPTSAPVLVPVSDSDSGSGADSGSVTVIGTAPSAVLTPPGRVSPMAFRFQAFPSQAPVLTPVSDSDSGTGTDSGSAAVATPPTMPPLIPPGRQSPMAWQFQAGPTSAPVLVPVSDSDSGSGADFAAAGPLSPSWPLTPPGRQSPAAWQWRSVPSGAPVLVPVSDSDSGSGADSGSAAVGTSPSMPPLIPPGRQSPMAWQFQAGPSGAPLLVPVSDSDSGTGAESAYAGPPVQSQVLVPPGRISPAGWQWRALPSGAPLLVPVSDSDSGTGADSGSVFTQATAAPYQLNPPGRQSPMAFGWQRWPSAVPAATPSTLISDSDAGAFDDEASVTPVIDPPPTGGWWQLHSIIEYARQEREFYATRPPMACPRCGEPMRPAPPSDSGSEVELYCLFDNFQYPRDWRPPFPV